MNNSGMNMEVYFRREHISSILELENSNADDRPSTPRGKVISPRSASKMPTFSNESNAPMPSLVQEFDMSAFGGLGGGGTSNNLTANEAVRVYPKTSRVKTVLLPNLLHSFGKIQTV